MSGETIYKRKDVAKVGPSFPREEHPSWRLPGPVTRQHLRAL